MNIGQDVRDIRAGGEKAMGRKKITEALREGRILVSDGAWGTLLYKKGLKAGECPELWNTDRYEDVKAVAQSYLDAGADMVETNSFGGTSCKLALYHLEGRTEEINEAAARASREAAGEVKWVMASIGPTGKMLIMEDITEEELYETFRQQAVALEKGGADAICIETMSDRDEAVQAIKAAKENTKCEIACTFTFEKTVRGDYRTMMGLSPEDAAKAAVEAGADIIGTNCGNGIDRMAGIVRAMRSAFPDMPILVQANAGLPTNIDGVDVFPETPETTASFVKELIEAGANIIGGCCGTTPAHIRAIRQAVDGL